MTLVYAAKGTPDTIQALAEQYRLILARLDLPEMDIG